MKIKSLMIVITMFFICINVFAQTSNLPRIMYVNAANGLVRRTEPSTNAHRIGVFLYGTRLHILERSSSPVTINGITEYWYKTRDNYFHNGSWNYHSWVFGGYLSNELPFDLPVIIGKWDVLDSTDKWSYYSYIFSIDENRWAEGHYEAEWDYGGTWNLNGNILTLRRRFQGHSASEDEKWTTLTIQLNIKDRNNVELKFNDNKVVRLRRNDDIY